MSTCRLALSFALLPLAAALHAPLSMDLASPKFGDAATLSALAKNSLLLNPTRVQHPASSKAPLQALRGGGNTPLLGCIGSLVKNIVGSGVLTLPGAVAAFSDEPKMIHPAAAIALIAGLMSAYCFALVGRTCALTGNII